MSDVPARIYDESMLRMFIKDALNENANLIIEYKSGKSAAFNSIVSKVMAKTGGRGDPETIRRILKKMIG
jgi:aspartyl-tRNA(Asn)/glutamyl-tRNA(Gln) amidotransferase subunit B